MALLQELGYEYWKKQEKLLEKTIGENMCPKKEVLIREKSLKRIKRLRSFLIKEKIRPE